MRRIRPVSGRLSRYLNLEDKEVAMYGDAKGLAIRIIEGSIWGWEGLRSTYKKE